MNKGMYEKINVLSLFDGMSGAKLALDNLKIPCNYFASEIDKYAISVSKYNYRDIIRLRDALKIKGSDLPKIDLLIGGSPCFVAGTKVYTDRGYKNIEDINIGDYVLTHKNRFRMVLNTGKTLRNILSLKAQGIKETKATMDHPYYVRKMKRKYTKGKNRKVFYKPEWKKLKELKKGYFIGLPILNTSENKYNLDKEDCWLIGRFIADGHMRKAKRKHRKNSYYYQVVYSVGSHKVDEFKEKVKRNFSCYPHTTSTHRCVISSKDFLNLLENLGFKNGAIYKHIPSDILNLPKNLLESVIDGYMSGDGDERNNVFRSTSVSEELIMGLNIAIAKVYNTNSSFEFTKRPKTTIIEGRVVNQNNTFTTTFRKEMKKQSNAVVIDDIVWLPIKKIKRVKDKEREVYNLEIKDDNSYTANNAIVHNCQGFSGAGKRKGFKDYRSNLFFEFVRLLKECNPEYFLLENVRMKKEWMDIISTELKAEPVLINSALVTAQTRKRLYWTNFPIYQPKDRKIYLKDILDSGVTDRDKSYCIDASYYKGVNYEYYLKKCRRQLVFDTPVNLYRTKHGYVGEKYIENIDKYPSLCAQYPSSKYKISKPLYAVSYNRKNGVQKILNEANPVLASNWRGLNKNQNQTVIYNNKEFYIRKLTPKECERLQGIPDDFTKYGIDENGKEVKISNTQRYKMIGNGFTIPVIEHILKELYETLF